MNGVACGTPLRARHAERFLRPGLWVTGRSILRVGVALCCLAGCAPALPSLSGGGLTPAGRVDIAAGTAARVPLNGLRSTEPAKQTLGFAPPGGLVPLLDTRLGLARELDLGLLLAGTCLRLGARFGHALSEQATLVAAVAPFAGWIAPSDLAEDESGDGPRYGVEFPLVIALSLGGVYQAWTGPRFNLERAQVVQREGDTTIDYGGDGIRAGWLFGFGVGFRRVHVLAELTADHEWWWLDRGDSSSDASGFSLTPAFALRLRI